MATMPTRDPNKAQRLAELLATEIGIDTSHEGLIIHVTSVEHGDRDGLDGITVECTYVGGITRTRLEELIDQAEQDSTP